MTLRLGSLCSGYEGLGMGIAEVLDVELAWVADNEPASASLLAHHWPDVPNLGDITKVDWDEVEPPDVLAAGFPCTDLSNAGKGAGLRDGTRSGIWSNVLTAVDILRPSLVYIENVRGLLNAEADHDVEPCPWCLGEIDPKHHLRALGRVLGDLADIGFDAEWTSLQASDVGAPHERFRVFILAWPATDSERGRREGRSGDLAEARWRNEPADCGDQAAAAGVTLLPTPRAVMNGSRKARETGEHKSRLEDVVALLPTPTVADSRGTRNFTAGRREGAKFNSGKTPTDVAWLLPTPKASDGTHGGPNQRDGKGNFYLPALAVRLDKDWVTVDGVDYGPAIRRWEALMGRLASEPTEPGARGNRRLSAPFVEWMMGLPAGHVTGVPGLTRNKMITLLGNGVLPGQAAHALRSLLPAWFAATERKAVPA